MRIVLIAGIGRSGSTILGDILGQAEGWSHVGEVRYLLDRGIQEDRFCGCGVPFSACPFWTNVLSAVIDHNSFDARMLLKARDHIRSRYCLFPAILSRVIKKDKRANSLLDLYSSLFLGIQKHSGADVIVDTSKFPSHAFLLSLLPDIEVHLIHLVRDPRAVAYSWAKRVKEVPDNRHLRMTKIGILRSCIIWSIWNYILSRSLRDRMSSYRLVRYEDFTANPEAVVREIVSGLSKFQVAPTFSGTDTISLTPSHSISGNPARHKTGTVSIEDKKEWKSRISPREKLLVTLLCRWGINAFGYPVDV